MADIARLLVSPSQTVREVMACLDASGAGIALVVSDGRLAGTITDGDVRRSILAGVALDSPAAELLARKPPEARATPLVAAAGTSDAELLALMTAHHLRQVPIVDEHGRVVDVALLSDLARPAHADVRAVVMAGGYGTRMRPLTDRIPKSMLPIGDKPLLEHIIVQLRDAGIQRVNVATHYRNEVIVDHFGDGRGLSVDIEYVHETEPLGTAGALGLLEPSSDTLLVINGDILTRVDFRAMLEFHRDHAADMTVGVRAFEVAVPYGVVESDDVVVTAVHEKPIFKGFVNAGIYLLRPDLARLVPAGERYEMTQLIARLIADRRRVISFPIREYWRDIGQAHEYDRAVAEHERGL